MRKFQTAIIASIVAALVSLGCSTLSETDQRLIESFKGKTIFSRVGMHAETKGNRYVMYSTNFYSLPVYWPPNSKFLFVNANSREIFLKDMSSNQDFQIIFNKKHSIMTVGEYLDLQFSLSQVARPDNISDKDWDLVQKGKFAKGMSKDAFILALGYPPRVLTPDYRSSILVYQAKRFNNTNFTFQDERLADIKE